MGNDYEEEDYIDGYLYDDEEDEEENSRRLQERIERSRREDHERAQKAVQMASIDPSILAKYVAKQ